MKLIIELKTHVGPETADALGRVLAAAAALESTVNTAPTPATDDDWPLGDPQVVDDVSRKLMGDGDGPWNPPVNMVDFGTGDVPPPPGPAVMDAVAPAPSIDVAAVIPPPPDNCAPKMKPDSAGAYWDPVLHAKNKSQCADGTWKKKRGTATVVTATTVVTLKEVQLALGKLHRGKVDVVAEVDEPMTQAITGDMKQTTGGMKILMGSKGEELAAGCRKAMGAIAAIAVMHGIDL